MSNTDLTEYDIRDSVARRTPCDVAGCDMDMHEGAVSPEDWSHQVVDGRFDGKTVMLSIYLESSGKAIANLSIEAEGDMTAEELRADAELYEAYPAWLRSMADKLDSLNS